MKTGLVLVVLCGFAQGASWRADLAEAKRLQGAGESEKAARAYQSIVDHTKGLAPLELNALALELFYAGRYNDSESVYHEALAGWERTGAAGARDRIVTASNLGTLLRAEGRYPEAESLLLDCLRKAESVAGKDSLEAARVSSGLAALYLAWTKYPQAESAALRAKRILEQSLPAGHTERANILSLLGSIYLEEGRYVEAEQMLHSTLEGASPRLAARAYSELAVSALRQHRLDEAESLEQKALQTDRLSGALPNALTAAIRNNLADICLAQKRYVEAEQHYREAIEIWESIVGKQHPDTAKAYMNLGNFYHLRGRESGAEELYRRAAGIFEKIYGRDHLLTLVATNELADVLRAEGRYTESERLGSASLAGLREKLPPGDPRLLHALENEARLLAGTRRPKDTAALRDKIEQMGQGFRKGE
jgi:tetratricopeptide (TPR) repeat protein